MKSKKNTLLMITRKVDNNDALAGFAYNWVSHIGKNLDFLYVVTWQKSDSTGLSDNIRVISLPDGKFKKIFKLKLLLFKLLPKVDGVFCHMNPEYTIIAAPIAKMFRKNVVSWYTHSAITIRRRLLELLANKIVTASEKSFRQPWFKKKVEIIGHGIDIDVFKENRLETSGNQFNVMSVGRISPTKDYESIIKAVSEIKNDNINLNIVGDVILKSQKGYLKSLKGIVESLDLNDRVKFLGWVANKDMPPYYQKTDLFINMSGTGSVDKVVLEAMACGCLVLTSNEAFESILGSEFMVRPNDHKMLAEKIEWLMNLSEDQKVKMTNRFRQIVVDDYELNKLSQKIIKQFI